MTATIIESDTNVDESVEVPIICANTFCNHKAKFHLILKCCGAKMPFCEECLFRLIEFYDNTNAKVCQVCLAGLGSGPFGTLFEVVRIKA